MQPLALEPFDQVYLLRRVRYADGRAICYCENHCLPQRVPALLSHDLNGSLTEVYQQHYALIYSNMHLSFYPTALPYRAANALGAMVGLLRLVAAPVELRSARPHSRFRYRILAPRQPAHRSRYALTPSMTGLRLPPPFSHAHLRCRQLYFAAFICLSYSPISLAAYLVYTSFTLIRNSEAEAMKLSRLVVMTAIALGAAPARPPTRW